MRLSIPFIMVILISTSPFARASQQLPDYEAEKLTGNTWVIHGPVGLPNRQNRGFMNNPSFTVTPNSVVVVDPGSSRYSGKMVLRQISKVTKNPVTHVFVSHIHGDHWLGSHAIKEAYPNVKIHAHPEMIRQARAGEAQSWVQLMEQLTEGITSGTRAIIPTEPLQHGQEINVDGYIFRMYLTGQAHTRTDVMIEIVNDGVMVLGDNVLNRRIGRMDDGSFRGSKKACDIARRVKANIYIPGHGPSGDAASTLGYCDYLQNVYTETGKLVEQGLADFEMKSTLVRALGAYRKWSGFDRELGRHISLSVLEYEQAAFE